MLAEGTSAVLSSDSRSLEKVYMVKWVLSNFESLFNMSLQNDGH